MLKFKTKIIDMTYPDGTVVKNPVFFHGPIAKVILPVTQRLGLKKFIYSAKD